MKRTIYLLFASLILFNCADAQGPVIKGAVQPAVNNEVDVYIFGGQSNMPVGVVSKFEDLIGPLAPGRIRTVLVSQPGATMFGEGGVNDWKVSETTNGVHYETLSAAILTELADIVSDGYTPIVRGFTFRQGEAEVFGCCSYSAAQIRTLWALEFGRLVKYLTDDMNEAGYQTHNMRVLVQRIHSSISGTAEFIAAIQGAQEDVAAFETDFTGYGTILRAVDWQNTDSFHYIGGGNPHYTDPQGQQDSADAIYAYFAPFIDESNSIPSINTSGFDSDAIAFLSNNQCRVQVQADAVNTLVLALKSASVWTKIVAAYPIVGGHRVAHKYNLVNPLDTDGAYRLTHNKSWDHLDDGFYGDGTAGYAETYLAASTLGQNTAGYAFYSMTSAQEARYGMGTLSASGTARLHWGIRWTDDKNYPSNMGTEGTGLTNTDGSGFFLCTRTSSTNFNAYIRGTKRSYTDTSAAPDANTFTIGARNFNGTKGSFSTRTWAMFILFNASISDADELALRNAITTFETAIGR